MRDSPADSCQAAVRVYRNPLAPCRASRRPSGGRALRRRDRRYLTAVGRARRARPVFSARLSDSPTGSCRVAARTYRTPATSCRISRRPSGGRALRRRGRRYLTAVGRARRARPVFSARLSDSPTAPSLVAARTYRTPATSCRVSRRPSGGRALRRRDRRYLTAVGRARRARPVPSARLSGSPTGSCRVAAGTYRTPATSCRASRRPPGGRALRRRGRRYLTAVGRARRARPVPSARLNDSPTAPSLVAARTYRTPTTSCRVSRRPSGGRALRRRDRRYLTAVGRARRARPTPSARLSGSPMDACKTAVRVDRNPATSCRVSRRPSGGRALRRRGRRYLTAVGRARRARPVPSARLSGSPTGSCRVAAGTYRTPATSCRVSRRPSGGRALRHEAAYACRPAAFIERGLRRTPDPALTADSRGS